MRTRFIGITAVVLGSFVTVANAERECSWNDNFQPPPALGNRDYCTDLTDPFVEDAISSFGLVTFDALGEHDHWDGQWAGSPGDVNSPKCIVLEAISVLERASAFAPDHHQILKDGYDLARTSITKLKPQCKESGAPAASGASRKVQDALFTSTGLPFAYALTDSTRLRRDFLQADIAYRASVLRHEAAHRDGLSHARGWKDNKYQSSYEADTPSVNSQQVDWLYEYALLDENRADIAASVRSVINQSARDVAVENANWLLEGGFLQEPGFRINVPNLHDLATAASKGTTWIDQAKVYQDSDFQNGDHLPALMDAYVPEACGLTGIAGDLQRDNHKVFIHPSLQSNGLQVQALRARNTTSVSSDKTVGWAQCFPGKLVTTHELWLGDNTRTQTKDLGPALGQVCYLMGFGGTTNGTYERARVQVEDGRWVAELRANNESSESLEALFGCISGNVTEVVSAGGDQNHFSAEFFETSNMGQPYPVSCVLSEVYGRFRNTKSIKISLTGCDSTSNPTCHRYQLDVDQNSSLPDREIGGSMTCFTY